MYYLVGNCVCFYICFSHMLIYFIRCVRYIYIYIYISLSFLKDNILYVCVCVYRYICSFVHCFFHSPVFPRIWA